MYDKAHNLHYSKQTNEHCKPEVIQQKYQDGRMYSFRATRDLILSRI